MTPRKESIRVLFFARAREITKTNEFELTFDRSEGLCDELSVVGLVRALESQFGGLRDIRGAYALAVNQEYVQESDVVRVGDEVAVIPPISGG
jgi:molybdopterin converting factor subunit 1